MKNLISVSLILLLCHVAQAQIFNIGLKAGLNTQINKADDISIGNGGEAFKFGVDGRQFGTQFGGFVRLGNGLFVQPEVLFNSNKISYRIGESSVGEVIKNERYQYLDFPVMAGIKLGPIRLMAGPVGHYFLSSRSELDDIDGYEAKFDQMSWGWQGGASVGFGRLALDARYEGNFSKQANHINFFGENYAFSNNPARFILSLSFALLK